MAWGDPEHGPPLRCARQRRGFDLGDSERARHWRAGRHTWLPSPDDYVDIYRRMVRAIREEDPHAVVGGPAVGRGMANKADDISPFVTALVEAAADGGVPLDFVSGHLYGKSINAMRRSHAAYRALLDRHGLSDRGYALSEWNLMHKPFCGELEAGIYWPARAAYMVAALLNFNDLKNGVSKRPDKREKGCLAKCAYSQMRSIPKQPSRVKNYFHAKPIQYAM